MQYCGITKSGQFQKADKYFHAVADNHQMAANLFIYFQFYLKRINATS